MRTAYDALQDEMKQRLRGLVAEHANMYSGKKLRFIDFSAKRSSSSSPNGMQGHGRYSCAF